MGMFSKIHTAALVVFLPFTAISCANLYEPKPVTSDLREKTVLSSTASLSHMVVRAAKTDLITCTQPQPDAAFDQSEAADFSLSLITLGGDDQAGEDTSSSEVEMAGRTPAVLMARELFYRACEFSDNYKLSKDEALTLYTKTLDSITKVWGTEAGNTTITVGDTVATTSGTTVQSTTAGSITSADTKPDTSTEEYPATSSPPN